MTWHEKPPNLFLYLDNGHLIQVQYILIFNNATNLDWNSIGSLLAMRLVNIIHSTTSGNTISASAASYCFVLQNQTVVKSNFLLQANSATAVIPQNFSIVNLAVICGPKCLHIM